VRLRVDLLSTNAAKTAVEWDKERLRGCARLRSARDRGCLVGHEPVMPQHANDVRHETQHRRATLEVGKARQSFDTAVKKFRVMG